VYGLFRIILMDTDNMIIGIADDGCDAKLQMYAHIGRICRKSAAYSFSQGCM